jgi:hypothetical protein
VGEVLTRNRELLTTLLHVSENRYTVGQDRSPRTFRQHDVGARAELVARQPGAL